MKTLTIRQFIEEVRRDNIDLVNHARNVLDEVKSINKKYNYFNLISEEQFMNQAAYWNNQKTSNGLQLLGIPLAIKDSIVVKGVESRAGSRILEGYKPLFSATCVEQAQQQGGMVLGKTSQDEFGFGAFSVNTGLGFEIPKNPFDPQFSCGGSSGGAAGIAQKAGFPVFSYGESTGGSIVNPASFCGVFGLCPTYGLVSRYGLIDYGNSLDKIGPIAKSAEDIALMLNVMSGHDEKDSTSLDIPKKDYSGHLTQDIKGMKIGVLKEGFLEGTTPEVARKVMEGIAKLEDLGATTHEVSTETTVKYGVPTYYFLGTSEVSTNLAKMCGMRYGKHEKIEGNFNHYFTKVRSEHFGKEAKRRIMIGTFARMAGHRDAYYIRAAQVRNLIIQEYKKIFSQFDAIISPTVPYLPPKIEEISKLSPIHHYMADVLTVGPNLAGLPHINIPVGKERGLPVGMLATSDHLQEGTLLRIAKEFEYVSAGDES